MNSLLIDQLNILIDRYLAERQTAIDECNVLWRKRIMRKEYKLMKLEIIDFKDWANRLKQGAK